MVGELITGVGLFKSMLDTAKGLKDMNDAAVRNAAAIELQEKILAVQAEQTALVDRISDLEKEMARFETWEAEKERYELTELPPGVFVYRLRPDMQGSEPMHNICEPCYQKGKKSVLHSRGIFNGMDHLVCHSCNVEIATGHRTEPQMTSEYDPFNP